MKIVLMKSVNFYKPRIGFTLDRVIEKKKWTPKKIALLSFAGLFLFFILYVFVLSDRSMKLNVEKERISISTVKFGTFQEFIPVIGNVQPIQTFYLDVVEGGLVVKKFLEEGAFVNVNDPIVELDNAQLRLNIIYNEANVFQQINSLRATRLSFEQSKLSLQGQLLDLHYKILDQKRVYETNKGLYEKNLISNIEYEKSKDQLEYLMKSRDLTIESYKQDSIFRVTQITQMEQSVGTLEANLSITKRQLENLTVKAPIKGQLTSLKAEIGQSINRGENLGQIDDIDSFKVRAEIDEHYIARIHAGLEGIFAFSGQEHALRIKTVYPEIKNGKFQVDMLFTGKMPAGIRRGQTVHINLNLSDEKQSLMVERGGFYQKTGGQWIFVVDPSGSYAVKRPIKLGQQNTQVFEVLEGLKEGEQVVVSSYENYGDVEKLILK